MLSSKLHQSYKTWNHWQPSTLGTSSTWKPTASYSTKTAPTSLQPAMNLLKTQTAPPTTLLTPPHNQHHPVPSASFKPPKLNIENWSCQPYDFYPCMKSVLNGFELAKCDDPGKLHHTLHAIPLNKRKRLPRPHHQQGRLQDRINWRFWTERSTRFSTSSPVMNLSKRLLKTLLPRPGQLYN